MQYTIIGTSQFAGVGAEASYIKPQGIYSLLPNTVANFTDNLVFLGVTPFGPQPLTSNGRIVFTLNFITNNVTSTGNNEIKVNALFIDTNSTIQTKLDYSLTNVNTGVLISGHDITHLYSGLPPGTYNIPAFYVITQNSTPLYGSILSKITDANGDVLYSHGTGNGATQVLKPNGLITFNLWFTEANVTGNITRLP